MKRKNKIAEMISRLVAGDQRAAARLMTYVENETEECQEVMKHVYSCDSHAMIIGVTGSGGAGKSTLINHLISKFRNQDQTVGVVVVDPSSPFTGGALLGDRIRLLNHHKDDGVYIRSMASRGISGGLSQTTNNVVRIMEAMGKDIIILETLGTGQDEIDVMHMVHTCLLILTPAMGDDIQAFKAGIMEIADIIVLNKADLKGADSSLAHLESLVAVSKFRDDQWKTQIVPVISKGTSESVKGIDELVSVIIDHRQFLEKNKILEYFNAKRIEFELKLILRNKLLHAITDIFAVNDQYTREILDNKTDPYTVATKILNDISKSLT